MQRQLHHLLRLHHQNLDQIIVFLVKTLDQITQGRFTSKFVIMQKKTTTKKKTMVKGYFLIITCCCTLPVHIELTPGISLKSFLLASRRCGITENIISDNFETFKTVEVHNILRFLRIKQNFILEKSAWQDGYYERMCVIQIILKKVVGVSSLDYGQLNTANSRNWKYFKFLSTHLYEP